MTDAINLLNDSGMLERIREDAQSAREIERTDLLAKLAMIDGDDAATAKRITADLDRAAAEVARLEGELRQARQVLNRISGERGALGFSAEKLRGKLRRLADPRLDLAVLTINELMSKARDRFTASNEMVRNPYTGRRQSVIVSNSETIADLLVNGRQTIAKLEAMKEAPRPDNLPDLIEAMVRPLRDDVRRLIGV